MKALQRRSTLTPQRFSAARHAAAVLVVGTIALTGCTGGGSDAAVAQARQDGAQAQAQKDAAKAQQDTQASLAAEVQRLKDEAAQAAQAKVVADKAAADKAAAQAAAQAAAASQAAAAKTVAEAQTSCGGTVSAGANTTCAFALNVASSCLYNGGGSATFEVWSPITSRYYTMSCTPGVTTVCRGGVNAVVYIR